MKTFAALMLFSLLHTMLFAKPLEIGSPAPQIKAITDEGVNIDFGAELASGTTLVFFYPKAMTPGCTQQACSLRDGWELLQEREVKIFGVSTDTAETQAAFKDKHALPFTLIADKDGAVCEAFGKSRWSRHAYLFQDGVLVWRDLSASTKAQADDVLAALDALGK
jgi:peroxiredoxin Q/BCP